ncbi:hypothetical protein [Pseudomonas fluorescens]|jgi:hypothetical protein|uniref:Uncharacterized protein n=1 Tax=Pseudomonas fluorescens TaxID=294 RepID=A0A2N1EDJ6_PSEFL|nr:hypothetical protein [Pseudomonas fluorescens]PKH25639.1 hypothetical protein CIB54_04470 [Pseudomonas fluorescens]
MTEQFNPEKNYELRFDRQWMGVVRKGLYYEGADAWRVGEIHDGRFYYNGKAAGTVDGLIVTRTEPKPQTLLQLVPLEE